MFARRKPDITGSGTIQLNEGFQLLFKVCNTGFETGNDPLTRLRGGNAASGSS
ncbi:hypothetical protein D3C81_2049210 [compost metagenome]